MNLNYEDYIIIHLGLYPRNLKRIPSAGKPIREIPLCELYVICKELILSTQIVSDIERTIEGEKMDLKIRHKFSNENVILKLVELFSKIFREAGHMFEVRIVSNLIIFKFAEIC